MIECLCTKLKYWNLTSLYIYIRSFTSPQFTVNVIHFCGVKFADGSVRHPRTCSHHGLTHKPVTTSNNVLHNSLSPIQSFWVLVNLHFILKFDCACSYSALSNRTRSYSVTEMKTSCISVFTISFFVTFAFFVRFVTFRFAHIRSTRTLVFCHYGLYQCFLLCVVFP